MFVAHLADGENNDRCKLGGATCVVTATVATPGKTGSDMTAKCGDISKEPPHEYPLDLAHHIRSMHPKISWVPEDNRLGQKPAWYYHLPPTSACLL